MTATVTLQGRRVPAVRSGLGRSVCERKEPVRSAGAYAAVVLRCRERCNDARRYGKGRNSGKRGSHWRCCAAADARTATAGVRRRIMLAVHLMRCVARGAGLSRVAAVLRTRVQHPRIAQDQGEPKREQRAQ